MAIECEICNKEFIDDHTFQNHLTGPDHLKKDLWKNSIFIHGIPFSLSVSDLMKHFMQFGEILTHKWYSYDDHNNMVIAFKDKEPVEIILSTKITINNVKLFRISRATNFDTRTERNKKLCYSNKAIFNNKTSFDNQLTAFLNTVSINDLDIKRRYEPVCQALDQVFQTIFPRFKSFKFGSTLCGSGLKDCDLDIYLSIGVPIVEENVSVSGPHIISMDRLFPIVERTLRKHPKLFEKCFAIRQAKMPIIKCVYLPTKVYCDISFKNNLAVHNSQLVKFYLAIDSRFQPIMIILKYWINILGSKSNINITKYALTMLFIFYLQQIKLVPSIFDLQQECAVPITVKGWQVNYDKNLASFKIRNHYKDKCIPQLLEEFFVFYANFDFKTKVICPIDGHSYNKELFEADKNLPLSMMRYQEYLLYKKNPQVLSIWKSMCLQDPIELNNNLTNSLCRAHVEQFQFYCFMAAKIVKASSENNSYQDLLQNLFDYQSYSITQKVASKKIEARSYFTIYLDPDTEQTTNKDLMKRALFIKNNWFDLIVNMIRQYLEKVLNFEVKIGKIDDESNQKKNNHQENVNSKNEDVIVLHCNGNHRLWLNRKIVKIDGTDLSPLQKEISITKMILKDIDLKDSLNTVIGFECHISKKTEPSTHVFITLVDKGCIKNVFPDLASNLMTKMTSVIKKNFIAYQRLNNLQLY